MGGVTGCGPRDGARRLGPFPAFLPPAATGGRDRRQLFLFFKNLFFTFFMLSKEKRTKYVAYYLSKDSLM